MPSQFPGLKPWAMISVVPMGLQNENGYGILIIILVLKYQHCWKNHINCRNLIKLVVHKIVPMGLGCISSIIKPRVETLGYNKAVPLGLRNECGCGILVAVILVLIYRKQKSHENHSKSSGVVNCAFYNAIPIPRVKTLGYDIGRPDGTAE